MDKDRKLINDLAKDEAKHKARGDKYWAKSFKKNLPIKKARYYRRKARTEYRIGDSLSKAQSNLPNITRNTNITIASNNKNNKILSNNKASAKLSPKVTVKIGKNKSKKN